MVRDQIINAAVTVFSQKGYHPASMDAIAQSAGVAKGSLYYHFRSKSDLFTAVICEGIADMRRQIETILAVDTGIQEIFTAVTDSLLRTCAAYPALADLIIGERISELDPATHAQIRRAKDDFTAFIAGLIGEGIHAGLLRPCNAMAAAAGTIAYLYAYQKASRAAGQDFDPAARDAGLLIMSGLRKP